MGDFKHFVGIVEAACDYESRLNAQLDLIELATQCGLDEGIAVASLHTSQAECLRSMLEHDKAAIWNYLWEASFLPKRGLDKQRTFSPWEKERAADITQKKFRQHIEPRMAWMQLAKQMSAQNGLPWQQNIEAVPLDQVVNYLQARNALPDLKPPAMKKRLAQIRDELTTNLKAGTPVPFTHDFAATLRNVVKEQEPIIQAWKEVGLDKNPQEVLDLLRNRGVQIISPDLVKYATIDLLKNVRDKVQAGQALETPEAREAYKVWQDVAKANPMRKTDDPTKAVGPEDVYRALEKAGISLVRPEEVELQLINKVKQDIEQNKAYEEDPNKSVEAHQKKFQRAINRWVSGEGEKKGISHVIGTDEPTPDPYVSIDYHASKKGRDPKVMAMYFDAENKPTDLFYEQIMKVACMAVNQVILKHMKRVGFIPGHFQIDYKSRTSICGADNPENAQAAQARSQFLGGQDTTDLVQTVVQKLLDSTAIPRFTEQEGIRMRTAQIEAEKLLLNLLKAQNQYHKIIGGKRSDVMSKTQKGAGGGRASQSLSGVSTSDNPELPEQEPEEDKSRRLLDQEVLQRLLNDPEALDRLRSVARNAEGEEGDKMRKLVAKAEKKLAKMQ